ncbi:MAG: hypothetical protein WBG86_03775, partial [Polyangiales bacterium]
AQARYQRCLTPDCSEVAAPINVFPDSAVETRDARAAVLPSGDLAVTFLEGRLERYATICDLDDVCEPPTLIDSESSQYITGEAPVDTAPNGDILFAYVDSVVASGDAFELKLARLSRPQWQNVSTDDFETGLGSFSLGGGDARRGQFNNKSAFIYGPSFAIRLRDDSGVASSMESAVQDLSAFSEVRMTFWFSADSIEGQEDLLVEFWDGAQWNQVGQYVNDVDFLDAQENGGVVSFNNPEVVVTASQFDLSQAQFRIRADASGNGDRFFVDDVVIDAR